ncbi:hypothetical protein ACWD3I_48795 [Streptomyces sp. NPDC002817]|uniref:hypothetical protein n=1 Tax=Streptomyces sp. NPDC088357 TaxID=3154655 RepID=UPI00341A15EB
MAPHRKRAFLAVVGVGTLRVLAVVLSADDLPAMARYLFLIVWAVLMGWLFYATLRCATSFDVKAPIRSGRAGSSDIGFSPPRFGGAGCVTRRGRGFDVSPGVTRRLFS